MVRKALAGMKFSSKAVQFFLAAAAATATAVSSHALARPSIDIPNQSSRPLGVLGGVGPKSTAEFYEYTTEIYENVGGQTYQGKKERPQILIYSLPLDTNKEAEFIKSGAHKEMYEEEMIRGAKVLMEAGVRMAVIPCNTIHQFLPAINSAIDKFSQERPDLSKIQFKSILDTTVEMVSRSFKANEPRKTLLLATGETIRENLYNTKLKNAGIEVFVPASQDTQKGVIEDVSVINVPASSLPEICLKAGKTLPQDCINHVETSILLNVGATQDEFAQALAAFAPTIKAAFAQGIKTVILGCTDFQLVITESNLTDMQAPMAITDSLDSLVVWSAQYMCGDRCSYEQIVAYDRFMVCKRNKDNPPEECSKLLDTKRVSYDSQS
jgi:aspartate/glutamate racemase